MSELFGRVEVNDTPIYRNDLDTQLTYKLGNPSELNYTTPIDELKVGAKFNININDGTTSTEFEVLKVEENSLTGFKAAIIKNVGTGETIAWADGSKGFNNLFQLDSLNPLNIVNTLKTVNELTMDWIVNDALGIGSGSVFPQLSQLKGFIDAYGADKIDTAIGQSMMGVGMSALAYTEGYQNIQFRTYSGCLTAEIRNTIANTEGWGLNSLNGSNLTSYYTPNEPLLTALKPYVGNNKFYIKESINPEYASYNPHSSMSYNNTGGNDSAYYEVNQFNQDGFPIWEVNPSIDINNVGNGFSIGLSLTVPDFSTTKQIIGDAVNNLKSMFGLSSDSGIPFYYKATTSFGDYMLKDLSAFGQELYTNPNMTLEEAIKLSNASLNDRFDSYGNMLVQANEVIDIPTDTGSLQIKFSEVNSVTVNSDEANAAENGQSLKETLGDNHTVKVSTAENTYTVKSLTEMEAIAQKYGTTVDTLKANNTEFANGFTGDGSHVLVGSDIQLQLPTTTSYEPVVSNEFTKMTSFVSAIETGQSLDISAPQLVDFIPNSDINLNNSASNLSLPSSLSNTLVSQFDAGHIAASNLANLHYVDPITSLNSYQNFDVNSVIDMSNFTMPTAPYSQIIIEDVNAIIIPKTSFNSSLDITFNHSFVAPLVFDLDGDGIETLSIADTDIYFDMNGDGFAEKAGWISGDDGALVVDLNGNGTIDDVHELMGDNDSDGSSFNELAAYDSNNDGIIDANDTDFNDLLVWQDANEDAITDAGELKTLTEVGISSINLDYTNVYQENNDNTIEYASNYTKVDGSSGLIADVYYKVNETYAKYMSDYVIDMDLIDLPWLKGYGETIDLIPAASADADLETYLTTLSQETDINTVKAGIDELLQKWTGVDSALSDFDKKVAILEQFTGTDFSNSVTADNIYLVEEAYKTLHNKTFTNFVAQSAAGASLGLSFDFANDLVTADPDVTYTELMNSFNDVANHQSVFAIADSLKESATIDYDALKSAIETNSEGQLLIDYIYNKAENYVFGDSIADTITGTDKKDFIVGYDGNDVINSGAGNDVIYGGLGNDSITDTEGDDTYIFSIGNGEDTITDSTGLDLLKFDEGIASTDLTFLKDSNDLVIGIENQTDKITIKDWYASTDNRIDNLVFADGTILSQSVFDALLGTPSSDVISGTGSHNTYYLSSGDDSISDPGGSDTYIFNLGDGHDTIRDKDNISIPYRLYKEENYTLNEQIDRLEFGPGITQNDLSFIKNGNSLVININGTNDSVTVSGWFHYEEHSFLVQRFPYKLEKIKLDVYKIELMTFADGTYLTRDQITDITYMNNIVDDTHTILGSITDPGGNDTYLFNRNQGQAIIADDHGVDKITFAADITADELNYTKSGDNLIIGLNGTTDSVTISGWYTEESNRIESLEFDDGTIIEADDITSKPFTIIGDNSGEEIVGYLNNDTISGLAGNDSIYDLEGDDSITAGTGDDEIQDYSGDDTYVFNYGDGSDTITDNIGTDTLKFTENIAKSDIQFVKDGYDLKIEVINTADMITITDWFKHDNKKIEKIEFIDNTFYEASEIHSLLTSESGTEEGDILLGNDSDNNIAGLEGNDYIETGAGNDTLDGGTGADMLTGGLGDDMYYIDNAEDVAIENANEGNDTIKAGISYTLSDNIENLELTGPADINATGNDLDNTITGNTGNNILDGGLSADTLAGGLGDDTYILDDADDVIVENADEGSDTVKISSSYTLDIANVENIKLMGSGNINATGNELDNTLTGNSGNNVLAGLAGNDTYLFNLGSGQDTITDTAGTDKIKFGPNITYDDLIVKNENNDLIITIKDTSDEITIKDFHLSTSNVVEKFEFDNGEVLEILVGTNGNDLLREFNEHQVLYGYEGNDIICGADGDDTMYGGIGDDWFRGYNGVDKYYFNLGDGQDTIKIDNGEGALDEIHFGDGITRDDVIFSENGADLLISIKDTSDSINLYNYSSTAVEMNKLVFANGSEMDNSEFKISAVGSDNNDSVTATSSDNRIQGYLGNDTLTGLSGNDDYIFRLGDGQDTIIDSSGTDSIKFENGIAASDLMFIKGQSNPNDLEIIVKDTSDKITVQDWFVSADNQIESVEFFDGTSMDLAEIESNILEALPINGTTGNDTLAGTLLNEEIHGLDGNDVIYAGGGNDNIYGDSGSDEMHGEAGDDTYYIDDAGDIITENSGEGTDTVKSSISYALGANVENLDLTGTDNLTATGNTLNNQLVGNSGNNTLDGAAGVDSMSGGAGDDTYIIDNSNDVVAENSGEGVDTVQSSVSYTLSSNIEELELTGTNDINATGNDLFNVITGNSGNNILDGGVGTDSLVGGLGDDTYIVDNTNDIITENATEGIDVVQASTSYTLSDNVENIELTGTDNIDAVGNDLANTLTGNSGENTLSGLAGDDEYVFNSGSGKDIIIDTAGTDKIKFESGITQSDLIFIKDSNNLNNLIVKVKNSTDQITIQDWFLSENNKIETIEFSDASTISKAYIEASIQTFVTVDGTTGNDSITTTISNEDIYGLAGNDEYEFNLGSGQDTITDTAGIDKIKFGTGISQDDLIINDETNDLIISIQGTSDQITIKDFNLSASNAIESFEFADNTVTKILAGTTGNDSLIDSYDRQLIYGYEGNDTLTGSLGSDTVFGGAGDDLISGDEGGDYLSGGDGNDTIVGQGANDTIIAGAGDDWMRGYGGADKYYFNYGDGNDTIKISNDTGGMDEIHYGEGIDRDDIIFTQSGADVIASIKDATDSINLLNYTVDGIELNKMVFADGSEIAHSDIKYSTVGTANADSLSATSSDDRVHGYEGDDTISALAGNDIIYGNEGNDSLIGDAGDDTYIFGSNSDQDVISDSAGSDTIEFDPDVSKDNVAIFMDGSNNLVIDYDVLVSDSQITVQDQANNTIEKLELSNGEYLTDADINQIIQDMTTYATDNGISMTSVQDVKNNADLMNIVAAGWHS